jgi:DsbC/DsbD-like thiol-disulfide interchange protein
VRLSVQLGVCDDICVPASLTLSADLDGPGAADAVIGRALKAQPVSGRAAGLGGLSCAVDPIADGLRVTATLALPPLGRDETVVFETARPEVWIAQSATRREGDRLIAVTEMVEPSGAPFALDRSQIVLTVLSEGRAVEITGCPAP